MLGRWYYPTPGFPFSIFVKSVLLVELCVAPLTFFFEEKSDSKSGSR